MGHSIFLSSSPSPFAAVDATTVVTLGAMGHVQIDTFSFANSTSSLEPLRWVHSTPEFNSSSSNFTAAKDKEFEDRLSSDGDPVTELAFSSVGSARGGGGGGCGCGGGQDGFLNLLTLGIALLALGVATGVIDLNNNGGRRKRGKRKRGSARTMYN